MSLNELNPKVQNPYARRVLYAPKHGRCCAPVIVHSRGRTPARGGCHSHRPALAVLIVLITPNPRFLTKRVLPPQGLDHCKQGSQGAWSQPGAEGREPGARLNLNLRPRPRLARGQDTRS